MSVWAGVGFSTLITTAARFRYPAGAEGLLRRHRSYFKTRGTQYSSTTHQKWQTLIVSAHSLSGPGAGQRRQDFELSELQEGTTLYLEQTDNLSGKGIFRMHITKASADRIVFDVENVSSMRYFMVTLFPPGEMQSIYFLDREPDGVWRYYSMARTGRNASRLTSGHDLPRSTVRLRSIAPWPASTTDGTSSRAITVRRRWGTCTLTAPPRRGALRTNGVVFGHALNCHGVVARALSYAGREHVHFNRARAGAAR